MSFKIVIGNHIKTQQYKDAISTVYAPNKGPITDDIVLPEGIVLTSADAFYKNNGEILRNATINLNPKS